MSRPPSPQTLAARADAAAIRAAFRGGESRRRIAARYGCHRKVITDLVVGLPGGSRPKALAEQARTSKLTIAQKRALTNDDYATALADADGDLHAVAARFGVLPQTVRRRTGIVKPYTGGTLPIAELVRRYEAGATIRTLAQASGIPRETIRRRLLAAGARLRPVGINRRLPVIDDHAHAICVLYRAGASTTLLARGFGVDQQVVARRLRVEGVPLRSAPSTVARDPRTRARLERACADVIAGRLVVESGRLVNRLVA